MQKPVSRGPFPALGSSTSVISFGIIVISLSTVLFRFPSLKCHLVSLDKWGCGLLRARASWRHRYHGVILVGLVTRLDTPLEGCSLCRRPTTVRGLSIQYLWKMALRSIGRMRKYWSRLARTKEPTCIQATIPAPPGMPSCPRPSSSPVSPSARHPFIPANDSTPAVSSHGHPSPPSFGAYHQDTEHPGLAEHTAMQTGLSTSIITCFPG